jgi:hypothetical protein
MPTFRARTLSLSPSPTPPPSSPVHTRPNSPTSNLIRHPNFYLPGADLFIQIDNTLFAIHRYFFIRESTRWVYYLRNITQGSTARNPIVLVDTFEIIPIPTVDSFSEFLWVFYNPNYTYQDTPAETWWTIETYATYFQMRNVLGLVQRELLNIFQEQRYHRQSSTIWQTLSQMDGSNNSSTSTTDELWESSTEYDWINDPAVTEEVSLLLNRPHLQDGAD